MPKAARNLLISIFTAAFIFIFHYESLRAFYLNPFFHRELPKTKFLFPPAGWIMFFNVDASYGSVEVYGIKHGAQEQIDPHKILETKAVLYDNIHRNIMVTVESSNPKNFCALLERKFPDYENFAVVATYYPSVIEKPSKKLYRLLYTCE